MGKRTTQDKLNHRRKIIFQHVVLGNRTLTVKYLRELLEDEDYNEAHADTDAKAFQDMGCNIVLTNSTEDPHEKMFYFRDGPHTDSHRFRETINRKEKELVAKLAASAICGFSTCEEKDLLPGWMNDREISKAFARLQTNPHSAQGLDMRVAAVLLHLAEKTNAFRQPMPFESKENVIALVKASALSIEQRVKDLIANLYRFWQENSRLVAIDSGTTNIVLAQYLKQLWLPMAGSDLWSLTVCTNSRRIYEELGPADVSVRTIIIGGQQKFGSPTIAGTMAELFLRTATFLQFGMCVLGSTKIDIEHFAICTDSEEEASLKNLLMEKSSLRVVCVDDSKFQLGTGREGYRFASIDPKHIDLIITNSPLKKGKTQEDFAEFGRKIKIIEGRGVPVLVATSEQTFHDPREGTEA